MNDIITHSDKKAIQPWILFCLFSLSQSTESIYSTSLLAIRQEFGVDPGIAQVSSSAYFLGFAIGIFTLGRISDLYGRKPVVLFGMGLYGTVAAACALTHDIHVLIFLRFIQAIGASVGSVVAQAMARDSYQGSDLAKLYTTLSVGIAVVPPLSSVISSRIVENLHWRFNFVVTSAIAFILLAILRKKLHETNQHLSVSSKTHFVKIVQLILRDKIVLLYAVMIGCMNSLLYGFLLEAPFLFGECIGVSTSEYGQILFVLSFAYFSGSISGRYLLNKMDNRNVMFIGLMLSICGTGILLISSVMFTLFKFSQPISIIMMLAPFMIHALGHNLVTPIILRFALEKYHKFTGTAGSLFGCLYYLFSALMLFIISRIHTTHFLPIAILFFALSTLCFTCYNAIERGAAKEVE